MAPAIAAKTIALKSISAVVPQVASMQNTSDIALKAGARCSTCNVRRQCLPCGMSDQDAERVEEMVYTRRRIKRGDTLSRAGDDFSSLYAVRSGFFKSTLERGDGREQVTGFHMGGELVGVDGIGSGQHGSTTVALDDGEVCVIPYARLQELALSLKGLQQQFHAMMSREIGRDHGMMLLLGSMRAEQRLAEFLISMSQRFAARGYSATDFHLRMTRDEIGSYLGLKLETVSRAFSRLQESGLIAIQHKHVVLLDIAALQPLSRAYH